MASTTTMTSSLPQGSLKLAFARLDDDIYNSLAASQPASPSLGATKPILQPSELATPLSQPTSAPTSAPASAASKPQDSDAKIAPILTLLTNANLTTETITPLTTPDATFLCPHWFVPPNPKYPSPTPSPKQNPNKPQEHPRIRQVHPTALLRRPHRAQRHRGNF
jgi:hypothetical protein